MTERIAVFLDYQNVLRTGHGLFGAPGARDDWLSVGDDWSGKHPAG